MYGRENRLKVARDEAKYEEEQKEKRGKHEQVSALLLGQRCGTCSAFIPDSGALSRQRGRHATNCSFSVLVRGTGQLQSPCQSLSKSQ